MRDFDSELVKDRSFKLGGQVFHWRYPHWRVGAQLFDQEMTSVTDAASENGEARAFSFVADTEKAIERIPLFLDPENDAHRRFEDLVARETDPVPRHQIVQVYRYLVEVTSGFPTTSPSDSSAGAGNSDSSSEVVES